MTDISALPAPLPADRVKPPTVMERLADIPEEEIWLAKQKSARTRRAYRLDVRHFMATLAITTTDELRRVDHRAVIAWEGVRHRMDAGFTLAGRIMNIMRLQPVLAVPSFAAA